MKHPKSVGYSNQHANLGISLMSKNLLTLKEAAQYLNVSPNTVRNYR